MVSAKDPRGVCWFSRETERRGALLTDDSETWVRYLWRWRILPDDFLENLSRILFV